MNKLLILLFSCLSVVSFAQVDNNGNPVFNSIALSEESVGDYTLSVNYYTLKNNIEYKGSSVYISDAPTLDQIEDAAINLPSDFFMIVKDQKVINLVMLLNQPKRQFFTINPTTNENNVYPSNIVGDISEHRAKEIIKEQYDPVAKIQDGVLYFNNKKFTIIPHTALQTAIIALIDKEELSKGDSSSLIHLSEADIKKIVLAESKEGGKLDFFTEIKGHENDGVQIQPGKYTTKLSIALYQWGRANYELGVNTVENALDYWAEYKGKPANEKEERYIRLGFNKGWEK